ncbi:hypothetical protein [Paraburkholderia sp. BR13444]|uniref:hypothetical protein n=1 Tax=Paraburkholderia sp. BR13444 TaxID=3236997 RepID=UPI0034CD8D9D
MPHVERAIFTAAPHQGIPFASSAEQHRTVGRNRSVDPRSPSCPIGPRVCFRSIIAWCRCSGSLEDSDDGVVPYRSAHLAGALSEKAIIAGHSVQQTPRAILKIRRILHEDIEQIDQRGRVCEEAGSAK